MACIMLTPKLHFGVSTFLWHLCFMLTGRNAWATYAHHVRWTLPPPRTDEG